MHGQEPEAAEPPPRRTRDPGAFMMYYIDYEFNVNKELEMNKMSLFIDKGIIAPLGSYIFHTC